MDAIKTPAEFALEQKLGGLAAQLAQLPLEARLNLCAQVVLSALDSMQAQQPKRLGTAAHLTVHQHTPLGPVPLASLFAFAGPGAPQMHGILGKLLEDVKTTEAGLPPQPPQPEPEPVGLIVEGYGRT